MKSTTVSVSLAPRDTAILRRFRRNGRYQTNTAVVRAALQRLEETDWDPNAYPPGSLAHLYTPSRNRQELQLNISFRLRSGLKTRCEASRRKL